MPIIGHGDIASVLTDRVDRIYFASGVSNSSCDDWNEFQREKKLLMEQSKFAHLVYFSTLSIYYADTPYTRHKKTMERLVKDNFSVSTIVRIGNITWGKNPHTLINYLKDRIKTKQSYKAREVYRHIIDKEDFKYWVEMIPDWSTEMNLTGLKLTVPQIVDMIKSKIL